MVSNIRTNPQERGEFPGIFNLHNTGGFVNYLSIADNKKLPGEVETCNRGVLRMIGSQTYQQTILSTGLLAGNCIMASGLLAQTRPRDYCSRSTCTII